MEHESGKAMPSRGETRPRHNHDGDKGRHTKTSHRPPPEAKKSDSEGHDKMHHLKEHHSQTLWIYWSLILLGFWQILAPLTFDYGQAPAQPSGGREVWLSLEQRIIAMQWSDLLSGAALVVFGWRSLRPNRPVSLWACCFIGIWISLAPLLFWSPSALAYLNDTLVGMLVIALSILIPGMPNMMLYMKMGDPTPPGWSYNPSSWPQRWIMIVLGFAGWMVSRYLAAFQLGYNPMAWDPFFGQGTQTVLNSKMSHLWPISDAALGSLAYTLEFLMGLMGGPARWRTMPWMVAIFGILVIPLGLTHILLVISQPVVVGAWCSFCLLAALIMLPMIPLEFDEVGAMVQHLFDAKRKGGKIWQTFWKGGSPEGSTPDHRSPALQELPAHPAPVIGASLWGMSAPWTLTLSALIGLGLMFVPVAAGSTGTAADLERVCGALAITVSIIAMGEIVRLGRYVNVLLGLAVAILPWLVSGAPLGARLVDTVAGVSLLILALPRGPKREKYGMWDGWVR